MTDERGDKPIDEVPGIGQPRLVGKGGFGAVYVAHEAALDRDVAVKLLHLHVDESTKSAFERESTALGRLSQHPNIVTVYRVGVTGRGYPFLVMEHAAGGSLADRLRTEGVMGWAEAFEIGARICESLAAAHDSGVVHRDVKPANILLSAYGVPLLGDFGIAILTGRTMTQSRTLTASLAHASPEQISGSPLDGRTDIYSLASSIFELCSGRPAYVHDKTDDIIAIVGRIASDPVPTLPGAPEAAANVIRQAMAKTPDLRHQTVEQFGHVLAETARRGRVDDDEPAIAALGSARDDAADAGDLLAQPGEDGAALAKPASSQMPSVQSNGASQDEPPEFAGPPTVDGVEQDEASTKFRPDAIVASPVDDGTATGAVPAPMGDHRRTAGTPPELLEHDLIVPPSAPRKISRKVTWLLVAALVAVIVAVGSLLAFTDLVFTERIQKSVRVATDGSEQFISIEEAFASVDEAEEVILGPGRYELSETLLLGRPMTIVGDGPDQTVLVSPPSEPAIVATGSALALNGLTIEGPTDNESSSAAVFDGAEIEITNVHFVGSAGDGLNITGSTTGNIAQSAFTNNGGTGMVVSGISRVATTSSTATDNGRHGFHWRDRASGTATTNTASQNQLNGFLVGDDAAPTLESNTAAQNQLNGFSVRDDAAPTLESSTATNNVQSGFVWFERAGGTATTNTANQNQGNGFSVRDDAAPTLESNIADQNQQNGFDITDDAAPTLVSNTATNNVQVGFAWFGRAGGTATTNTANQNQSTGFSVRDDAAPTLESNTADQNRLNGFDVTDDAAPTLVSNTATNNEEAGFLWFGRARGSGTTNTANQNQANGFGMGDDAAPTLESNIATNNGGAGYAWFQRAGGTATANTADQNQFSGFGVRDDAAPTLESNTATNNLQTGFVWFGRARGTATTNIADRNQFSGFAMRDDAAPTLESNTADENQQSGFSVGGDATPTLESNIATNNLQSGFVWLSQAAGTATTNTANRNLTNGFRIQDDAAPTLVSNIADQNQQSGFSMGGDAAPTLESNTATNNVEVGFAWFGRAGGTESDSTATGNENTDFFEADTASPVHE